jgi:hypothetical protein
MHRERVIGAFHGDIMVESLLRAVAKIGVPALRKAWLNRVSSGSKCVAKTAC